MPTMPAVNTCSLPVFNNVCFDLGTWLVTAQPVYNNTGTPNPYAVIAGRGVRQVICVRDVQEIIVQPNTFDTTESEQLVLNTVAYTNAPLAHMQMTQAQFNVQAYNAATAIANAQTPVLVHCSTGDRASAAFAIYLITYLDWTNQEAYDFATGSLALANQEFKDFVLGYSIPST